MPAKASKYTVVRPFDRVDPKTAKEAHFEVGDTYSGDDIEKYLAYEGGPLIEADDSSSDSAATGSEGK